MKNPGIRKITAGSKRRHGILARAAAASLIMAEPHNDGLILLAGGDVAHQLIQAFIAQVITVSSDAILELLPTKLAERLDTADVLQVGIAALDAFLQANVTGPVLPEDSVQAVERRFVTSWSETSKGQGQDIAAVRRASLKYLETDGVAPYAHIPHLELFGLARFVVTQVLRDAADIVQLPGTSSSSSSTHSLTWTRLRINTWHYKLLTQPSLGPGSNFTKSSQWSDVPTLAAHILDGLAAVSSRVLGDGDGNVWASSTDVSWSEHDKVLFLVEAANSYILLGRNDLAKDALQKATQLSGLSYALSGALGKRTRFQEKSTSQLVVLAKSKSKDTIPETPNDEESALKPDALLLNNDTLLEEIDFTANKTDSESKTKDIPSDLTDLAPDDQPQLSPLDQIILLTEATLKDAFSPLDTLTSEEILPYAVRVLADKSTNWQIYTQALLVRSRIEVHRSRTVERGVLQLQAVADQVLTDTTVAPSSSQEASTDDSPAVPSIQLTTPDNHPPPPSTTSNKPTSFLPAPKPSESAPAHIRLQYIHALSSPPRWHLESELAYAWAGVGSLTSALEIFKRLRLWAEVALCLASAAATEDEDGRGSGGEEKAKGIIRWRLFHKTGTDEAAMSTSEDENDDLEGELAGADVTDLRAAAFSGPERQPPPPNAARLWCILGDLESEPAHYTRAWDISNKRYSRAQRSLGEHYLAQKDWVASRRAYRLATTANRLSTDMWSRLGDINLRLADFEEAAESYSRAIGSATGETGGESARTWSNLGSALWSLYCEVIAEKEGKEPEKPTTVLDDEAEEQEVEAEPTGISSRTIPRDPSKLISQSLAAYKKGASVAHDNWRIWDNVLTLAARMRPPSIPDLILALTHILRIRKTEDAVDADMLAALLADVVLATDTSTMVADAETGVYEPARGSVERLVSRLIEEQIAPLITVRSELWTLVSRLRTWKRDYAGAIDAAERSWRAAIGSSSSSSSGLLPGAAADASSASSSTGDWTSEKAAWETVVIRTDELASLLENYGPDVETIGPKWRGKVRSAVRSVMGKGRENWEGSEGWKTLEGIMDGLKADR